MTYLNREAFLPICINYNFKNDGDQKLHALSSRKCSFFYMVGLFSLSGIIKKMKVCLFFRLVNVNLKNILFKTDAIQRGCSSDCCMVNVKNG